MYTNLQLAREEKEALLVTLYQYLDETFSQFPLACTKGCSFCCTTKLWVTSIEAEYIFKNLREELPSFDNLIYPRPKLTHNQLALLYFSGEEPKESSQEGGIAPCPFLTEENLCKIYERRPVICRILNSLERCGQESSAVVSEELYLMGLIALQIVENIDIGGLYG
ncbi:MAG: YkgJ family cysteine cluster protein, partial [Caldimicrobium sp.]